MTQAASDQIAASPLQILKKRLWSFPLYRLIRERLRSETWPKHEIDVAYGIETSAWVNRWRLRTGDSRIDESNVGYAGSQPSVVRSVLASIPNLAVSSFVDIGCGKGRVMALASEFDFRRIAGIEISPDLAEAARRNSAIIAKQFKDRTPIHVVVGDATNPDAGDASQIVYFLYNPFGSTLVAALLANLERQLAANIDRKIFLVLYNPVHSDLVDQSKYFSRFSADRYDFTESEKNGSPFDISYDSVVVYQSVNQPMFVAKPGADRPVKIIIPGLNAEVVR